MKSRRRMVIAVLLLGAAIIFTRPAIARDMCNLEFIKEEGLPEEFPDVQTNGPDEADAAGMVAVGTGEKTKMSAKGQRYTVKISS